MRSGKSDFLHKNRGLHLTDHDLFSKAYTFRYTNESDRAKIGPMKLQTYVDLPSQIHALANLAIDASSFLPREFLTDAYFRNENFATLTAAFIRPTALNENNTITLDANGEPIVTINRDPIFNNSDPDIVELRNLTREAVEVITDALPIEILRTPGDDDDDTFFKTLELGGVAHELGTIPMANTKGKDNLKLRDQTGVYVCDLSVFPYSPEVNPTLTLTALALRLSRTELLPEIAEIATSPDTVYVVNQTGENIQVWVSNRGGVPSATEDVEVLNAGVLVSRKRMVGVLESVFVYRLNYNSDDTYQHVPQLYVGTPGSILPVTI
jgi:hypothetical protein